MTVDFCEIQTRRYGGSFILHLQLFGESNYSRVDDLVCFIFDIDSHL